MKINPFLLLITVLLSNYLSMAQERKQTEVLILGTYHLNQLKAFEPSMLDDILSELDSMDFQVISIENMPAELLSDIRSRQEEAFKELFNSTGATRFMFASEAQDSLGYNLLEAENQTKGLLKSENQSEDYHLNLFLNYVAAADLYSAALIYYTVNDYTQNFIDGNISKELRNTVQGILNGFNEINQIGIKLASIEKLNRLYYIDDLQDESILKKYYLDFQKEFQSKPGIMNAITQHPQFVKMDSLIEKSVNDENLFPLFAYLNGPEYVASDYDMQWALWFETNFESRADIARYYLWEMRNMQIAAKILQLIARHPTKRILVIIGSSHKGFLEKHLKVIQNIKLLQFPVSD